jgi:hypothetical protein
MYRDSPGDDYIEDDSYDNSSSSFSGTSDDGRHKLWAVAKEYDMLLTTQLDEQQVRYDYYACKPQAVIAFEQYVAYNQQALPISTCMGALCAHRLATITQSVRRALTMSTCTGHCMMLRQHIQPLRQN